MADEEEIDGSDFVGLDDEEITVEALEQKLKTLQEKKEQIEKRKKKEALLAKIKQAESELSNLQSPSVHLGNEIDQWNQQKIEEFFKTKGISVWQKPLNELKTLAKSIANSKLPDHRTIIRSKEERRTVRIGDNDQVFKSVDEIQTWSKDLTLLPSVEHFQAHAYILSSAEFGNDVNRLMNLQKEDGFVLYKDKCVISIHMSSLGKRYFYVKCICLTSCSNRSNTETVWILIHDTDGLESAGCSCSRDSGCCQHVIALLLTLASVKKTNERTRVETKDQSTQIYSAAKSAACTPIHLKANESDNNKSKASITHNSTEDSHSDDDVDLNDDVWTPPIIHSESKDINVPLPAYSKSPGNLQKIEEYDKLTKPTVTNMGTRGNLEKQLGNSKTIKDHLKELKEFAQSFELEKSQKSNSQLPKPQTRHITNTTLTLTEQLKPPKPSPVSSEHYRNVTKDLTENIKGYPVSSVPLVYPGIPRYEPVYRQQPMVYPPQPILYPGQLIPKPLVPARPILQPVSMPQLAYLPTANNDMAHLRGTQYTSSGITAKSENPYPSKDNASHAYGPLKILSDDDFAETVEKPPVQKFRSSVQIIETGNLLSDRSCTDNSNQRKVYSRRFLLFLQKSKFSKMMPGNLPDLPEIILSSHLPLLVPDKSFELAAGFVKGAPSKAKVIPKKTNEEENPGVIPKVFMSTEDVMRRVISAINMLKHGGDTKMVVTVISELSIDTEDSLYRVVSLVVDTVAEDPSLTTTCCNICRVLARVKIPKDDNSGQLITFSSVYTEKFEREIDHGIMSRPTEIYQRHVEEIARFTGAIARQSLLKNADIHDILMKLEHSSLASFCILLTDVWERMEKCKSEDYIDFYCGIIDSVLTDNDHPSTLRYKLLQLKNKRR